MKKIAFAALAAVFAVSGADATVLNLDSLTAGTYINGSVQIGDYVLSSGASPSAKPYVTSVNGHNVIAGTDYTYGDDTFLTRADGGAFTLNSVVIGLLSGYSGTGQAVSSATYADDLRNVATQTAQTINFGTSFTNVTRLDLNSLNGAYFTTINVSAASVPEAATWAMMIVGFGMVGMALRRRDPAVRFG